jgi:uncharacterized protein YkwD
MRAVPLAVVAAAVLFAAQSLPAATGSRSSYLAPARACPGSTQLSLDAATQHRALVCLVNWARRRVGLAPLRQDAALSRSADAKAGAIVACGEFSHSPCGRSAFASATAAGYQFRSWAEDIFWGGRELGTPRSAMQAWLLSPPHRENLFLRTAQDIGTGRVRTEAFAGSPDVTIWVLQVGTRR